MVAVGIGPCVVLMTNLVAGNGLPQSFFRLPSCALDGCEGGRLDMLGTKGAAHEGAVMVDPDLCQVAGIVEDVDLFADKGRQSRFDITPSPEADAVAPDLAGLRHTQKEHVESLAAFGKS